MPASQGHCESHMRLLRPHIVGAQWPLLLLLMGVGGQE